jgi:sulfatase maturation enzyme AslB (radical SAM superfamily)
MTKETLDKAMQWITINVSSPFVSFFGGEPMLEYQKIKYAIKTYPNIRFGLSTNISLLTPSVVKFFLEHDVRLLLSIDGFGEIYELTRGKGNFSKIAPMLPILGEIYSNAIFRLTVTPKNIKYLAGTIAAGLQLGFTNFHAVPNGIDSEWNAESYKEMEKQLHIIASIPQLKKSFRTFKDYAYRLQDDTDQLRCCDGVVTIGITTDGRFTLCAEQTDNNIFIVGDIYNGIDQNKVNYFQNQITPCEISCKANRICRREACYSRRLFCHGDLNTRIKSHCRWYNIIEEILC